MSKINAKCKDGSTGAITASGKWLPCCNFPDFVQYSSVPNKFDYIDKVDPDIFNSNTFSIKHNSKLEFHQSDLFQSWVELIENNYQLAPNFCKLFCSVGKDTVGERNVDSNFWCMDEMEIIQSDQDLLKLDKYDI